MKKIFILKATFFITLFCWILLEADTPKKARWESIGPEGGDVSGIARNVKFPNELYAVTNSLPGQVFKSKDGGKRWTKTTIINSYLYDVAVDPQNSDIVYVLGYDSFYKSKNRASTFKRYKFGKNRNGNWGRIAVDPTNSKTIYVTGNYRYNPPSYWRYMAIFKSTDGGIHWTTIQFKAPGFSLGYGLDIAVSPKNPNDLYFCGYYYYGNPLYNYCCVYKSNDGGMSWDNITADLSELWTRPYAVCADPDNWSRVFIATNRGVARTDNGGGSWSWQQSPSGMEVSSIAMDSSNSNVLYAGSHNVQRKGCYKSPDGGKTWKIYSNGVYGKGARILESGETILFASSAGVFISTDAGLSFKASHRGMQAAEIETFAVAPSSPKIIYSAISTYNFFKTANGGKTWAKKSDFVLASGIFKIAVHPTVPNTVYILCEPDEIDADNNEILYRSTDGGKHRLKMLENRCKNLAISVGNPGTLVVPGQVYLSRSTKHEVAIHLSTDNGFWWDHITMSDQIWGVANVAKIDPTNKNVIYVAATIGSPYVIKVVNDGSSWKWTDLHSPISGQPRCIAIDPMSPSTLYVGTSKGAWKSKDGGTSWTKMKLKSAVCIVINRLNSNQIFAGNDKGVFYSSNKGANWKNISKDLAFKDVIWLDIHPPSRTIYAATKGGGIWKRKF